MITTPVLRAAERIREGCQVRQVSGRGPAPDLPKVRQQPKVSPEKEERMRVRSEVGRLLATGLNQPQVAHALDISIPTVKWHVRMLRKGGATVHGGANRKPVIVDGKRYESIDDAKQAHGVSSTVFYRWLRDGRATHV